LRIRAGDQDALGGLGVVRLRQERFAEAEPLLAKAGAGSAQSRARWSEALASARFYGGLRAAQVALTAGDAAKAERLVAPLAGGSGRDVALAQQMLGDALARQGRLAEAEAAYRQAARNAPGSADIRTGLVEVLVAQGKIAEAEALVAQTPGGAAARSRPGRGSPRPRPTSCGRRAIWPEPARRSRRPWPTSRPSRGCGWTTPASCWSAARPARPTA
jgi:tetratricopeptide (TPR) repeat protein